MANTIDTCTFKENNVCIATETPKRNNYFSGKLMTHEHLITEQQYYINKLKQMNREFTGYGIVNGLTPTYKNKKITVNPGIGIDSCGNVLALHSEKVFPDTQISNGDYIYLRFKEEGTGKAARYTKDACSSDCCDDYILENIEIFTDPSHLVVEINDICLNKKDYFSDVLNILKSCGTSEEKILELLENKELGAIKEMLTECKVPKEDIQNILTRLDNLSEFKAKLPNGEQKNGSFLLLGKYVKEKIDNSYRTELHSNAELSKALCEIKASYVRTVNEMKGDVEIKAGKNIEIQDNNNTITIHSQAQSSFHKEFHFLLGKGDSQVITHKSGLYPVVDIYQVGKKTGEYRVIHKNSFEMKKNALNRDTLAYYEKYYGVKTINEHLKDRGLDPSAIKKIQKNPISTIFKDDKYTSSNSMKEIYDEPIRKYEKDIYIYNQYYYEKYIGSTKSRISLKVTQMNSNKVQIINLGSASIHLFVILSG